MAENRKKVGNRKIPFYDVILGQLTLLDGFWMLEMAENMKIALSHFIVLLGANHLFQSIDTCLFTLKTLKYHFYPVS